MSDDGVPITRAEEESELGVALGKVKARLAERKAERVRRGDGLKGLDRDSE